MALHPKRVKNLSDTFSTQFEIIYDWKDFCLTYRQPSLYLSGIPFKRGSHFAFTNEGKYFKKSD
jgi:hypothetical protein